jgi:methylated-DNA-[protein]-cysteine S-methyltransferase
MIQTPVLPIDVRTARLASPLGDILLSFEPDALTGLYFEGQKHQPAGLLARQADARHPVAQATARWLDDYFAGRGAVDAPPLRLRGTVFQQAVWQALQTLPYGQTATYAQVAQAAGVPHAVRAVGAAIGRNPVSILVPCHRVLGRDGSLTGYAGGLARKAALLRREGLLLPA